MAHSTRRCIGCGLRTCRAHGQQPGCAISQHLVPEAAVCTDGNTRAWISGRRCQRARVLLFICHGDPATLLPKLAGVMRGWQDSLTVPAWCPAAGRHEHRPGAPEHRVLPGRRLRLHGGPSRHPSHVRRRDRRLCSSQVGNVDGRCTAFESAHRLRHTSARCLSTQPEEADSGQLHDIYAMLRRFARAARQPCHALMHSSSSWGQLMIHCSAVIGRELRSSHLSRRSRKAPICCSAYGRPCRRQPLRSSSRGSAVPGQQSASAPTLCC